MSTPPSEPSPPLVREEARRVDGPPSGMAGALRALTATTLVAALVGLVPGPLGRVGGLVAVSVVVGAPLARVVWLAGHWSRRRDLRFVAVAVALLAVVAAGAVAAAATS